MSKLLQYLVILIKKKLIRPITRSYTPLNDLALGIGVGLFWAFTPLVGIQMYMVFLTWLIFKYIFRINLDLVVGCALVWISNPITLVPIYYLFYFTGYFVLLNLGNEISLVTFAGFESKLNEITGNSQLGYFDSIYQICRYLIIELGWPMVFGSMFIAIPSGIAGYFYSKPLIKKYRTGKAKQKNLTYEEWRVRYEKKPSHSLFGNKKKHTV